VPKSCREDHKIEDKIKPSDKQLLKELNTEMITVYKFHQKKKTPDRVATTKSIVDNYPIYYEMVKY